MEMIGIQRPRGRDVATGVVLGAGLGLAALFLYLEATDHNTTGATFTIVFGSLFAITSSAIPLVVAFSVIALGLIGALFRPLLLCSISPELAAGRGIAVRLVGAVLPARARDSPSRWRRSRSGRSSAPRCSSVRRRPRCGSRRSPAGRSSPRR